MIIAVAHHASGVGKTATAINLADALAAAGCRVLVVDLDPQADLSERLGLASQSRTLAAALTTDPGPLAVQTCSWEEHMALDIVASDLDTLAEVNAYRAPPVPLFGVVVTMMERTTMARQVEASLRDAYPELLFTATIPRRTVVAEDGRWQAPVWIYAPTAPTTLAYQALAQEVLARA